MLITKQFLSAGFALERVLDAVLRPLQDNLLALAHKNVPQTASSIERWLLMNKSIHANHLPLMNPLHVVALVVFYLSFVAIGRIVMKRAMTNVTPLVKLHNLFLASLSAYMALNVAYEAFYVRGYKLFQNPSEEISQARGLSEAIWLFYFSKIFEFVDTAIMVLKCNWRQVSFLHLYHHSSIFAVWWVVTFVAPTGEAYFSACLNSLIHVVMYSYYYFSASGYGKVKGSLSARIMSTVKPYITLGQMTQFCMMMVQATYDIGCSVMAQSNLPKYSERYSKVTGGHKEGVYQYPVGLTVMLWVYMVTMLALFGNFYFKNYSAPKGKEKCKPTFR